MRKVLLALVLLAWPVAAFGVDMGLLGGPVTFTPGVDTEITFDLNMTVAANETSGVQWLLLWDDANQNTLWEVSNVDASVNASSCTRDFPGYSVAENLGMSLQQFSDAMQFESWFKGSVGLHPAGTFLLAKVTIKPLADLSAYAGQTFTLGIPGEEHGNVFTAEGNPIGTSQALVVNIVPEPASALLLLLAAPFIRRRTA